MQAPMLRQNSEVLLFVCPHTYLVNKYVCVCVCVCRENKIKIIFHQTLLTSLSGWKSQVSRRRYDCLSPSDWKSNLVYRLVPGLNNVISIEESIFLFHNRIRDGIFHPWWQLLLLCLIVKIVK